MGRAMPVECEHGVVVDWGDFGPNPDDPQQGAATCEECESREYRVALRAREPGGEELDDVVVKDVSMFRMEQMERGVWWACCYLEGNVEGRLAFHIRYDKQARDVVVTVSERPLGVRYEDEVED